MPQVHVYHCVTCVRVGVILLYITRFLRHTLRRALCKCNYVESGFSLGTLMILLEDIIALEKTLLCFDTRRV